MKNYTIYKKKKIINFYVEHIHPNKTHHWQKKFPSST